MKHNDSVRRQPVQQRGEQRINRILDAADALFAEVGYDAATTNAIAQRAKTSIGSVYQFFKDKQAIVQTLAQRYQERLHAVHEAVLTPELAQAPLEELYDRVIRALADFHRTNPGFRPLFHGSPTTAGLAEAAEVLHAECIARVEKMLESQGRGASPTWRNLLARINIEVIKTLLPLSESGDEAFRELVLGEIKRMLVGYMTAVDKEQLSRPGEDSQDKPL